MDYLKIYNQIIERAKIRILTEYKEKHHVIPRCVGGSNEKENIVELTAREHFLCHMLLCEIYPNERKIKQALFLMARTKKYKNIKNSKLYEIAKLNHSLLTSKTHKGKTVSEKTKLKISQSNSKPRPEYFRALASLSRKGKHITEEHKNKIRNSVLGKKYSKEVIEKMKESYRKRSKEVLEKTKISVSLAKSSPILQYDLDGNFIKEWPSIKEAKKIYKGDIGPCCRGKQKTSAGYSWKYKNK